MKTKLLLSALLSFSFYLLSSQVPQGFNYQAIARDGSGNPITGATIKVKLSILTDTVGFRAGTGGLYVWEEEHTGVVTNAYGLFTVILGDPAATWIQGVTGFNLIDWGKPKLFIGTKIANPTVYKVLGGAKLWSVPYAMISGNLSGPVKKLAIKSLNTSPDSAIFEVKNNLGQTVFAVYNEGVRVYVDDGEKGITKGGFAIGSFGTDKAPSKSLLIVNTDSIRAYIDTTYVGKGITKGGFAIGGFGTEKGTKPKYLSVNANKTNISVNDSTTGFSVTNVQGGGAADFMKMNKINYFLGHESGLKTVVTGDNGKYNSFLGYQTGHENIIGKKNVFLGYKSGYKNNASYNVFVGNETGLNNVLGNLNVFIGHQAGKSNIGGQRNTFLGYSTGSNNTSGTDNVYVGYFTGGINQVGNNNVVIGSGAGLNAESGNSNVYVGAHAGENGMTCTGNVFIGYQAGQNEGGDNTLYIANSSTHTLIKGTFGTTDALSRIDLNGNLFIKGAAYVASDLRLKTNLKPIDESLNKILTLTGYYFFWNRDMGPSKGLSSTRQTGLIAQEVEKVFPEVVGFEGTYKTLDYSKMVPILLQAIKEQNDLITEQKKELENFKNELIELKSIVSGLNKTNK